MVIQEDASLKQKMREDKKKLEEARARASQKGPMGRYIQHNNYAGIALFNL